jgi:hypothetical protein
VVAEKLDCIVVGKDVTALVKCVVTDAESGIEVVVNTEDAEVIIVVGEPEVVSDKEDFEVDDDDVKEMLALVVATIGVSDDVTSKVDVDVIVSRTTKMTNGRK